MQTETVSILLVEDDEVDAEAIARAFRKARIANPIFRARDGVEALARLRGEPGVEPVPRPLLVLLDLNMPRMNGIELLTALRADPALRRHVVFVLTTSEADRDKMASYDLNVAGYLLKSRAGPDFMDVIEMLGGYWRVVEFPPGP